MNLLQHILYINLEHRTDRNEHFLRQMEQFNQIISEQKWGEPLQPKRFNAIRHPTHGALGCSQSHLECLKMAREKSFSQVCIMEDDFECTDPQLLLTQLKQFQDEFPSQDDWDVLMLGGNLFRSAVVPGKTSCNKVTNAQVAVGYIVQKHYYDTLIENFTNGFAHLTQQPTKHASYAVDMYWKSLQPQHKWFVIKPLTVKQLPSYSDIEKRRVNYDRCMFRLR